MQDRTISGCFSSSFSLEEAWLPCEWVSHGLLEAGPGCFYLPHTYFSGSHKTFLEATSTQNVCLEASCPFCSIQRRLVNQPLPERHTGRVASGFGDSGSSAKCGHGSAAHIGFHKGVGKCLACFGVTTRVHLGTH